MRRQRHSPLCSPHSQLVYSNKPTFHLEHRGVIIIPEFQFANRVNDPNALVHYPEGVVVVPPLLRTQRDAQNITGMFSPQFSILKTPVIFFSGKNAVKALTLLLDSPPYNMPVQAALRRERLWAFLGLFGRELT